jgi:hypothetical protein
MDIDLKGYFRTPEEIKMPPFGGISTLEVL